MSSLTRPGEARALYLASIANLYAQAQPEACAYWGSELNDLKASLETPLKGVPEHTFCGACGQIQIQGVSSTTSSSANVDGADAAPRKRTMGAEQHSITVQMTCLHCHRYSTLKPKISRPMTPSKAAEKQPIASITQSKVHGPSPISDGPSDRKAKRKQKRGGLAAMLARSRDTASNEPALKSLGFTDLARKL